MEAGKDLFIISCKVDVGAKLIRQVQVNRGWWVLQRHGLVDWVVEAGIGWWFGEEGRWKGGGGGVGRCRVAVPDVA